VWVGGGGFAPPPVRPPLPIKMFLEMGLKSRDDTAGPPPPRGDGI